MQISKPGEDQPAHHHHHNPPSSSVQSTTPLSTAVAVAHNHESLRKPEWTPVDNNFGSRDKEITDNFNNPAAVFEHERNTLPPTVKPARQSNNRQRPNGSQRSASRNSYPATTTTTTTTTEPSTMRWQAASTSRPGRLSGSAAIAISSQNGPAGRRKSNKRLVVKAKNILESPPQLASRPAPIYETPIAGSTAKKCDRNVCRLPDCNCGTPQIPGGLKEKDTPQLVSYLNSQNFLE